MYSISATFFTAVAVVLIVHHALFQSSFDQVIGDVYDTRFNLAVLEHWFRLLEGLDPWRSFNFFYPATGTLGYSDALVLLTPPYLLTRLVGGSAFQALQVTLVTMTVIGFVGTLLFLRGLLRLAAPVALTGAFVFAGNSLWTQTLSSGHIQMMAALWVPWLACLIVAYLRALAWRRGLAQGSAVAMMIAGLLYTSFNTGWFVAIQLLIIFLLLAIATAPRIARAVLATWWHWPLLTAVMGASLVPFGLTYLPVVSATGGRSYNEVAANLPQLIDLVHPVANLVWDPVAISLMPDLALRGGELSKGLTWTLLAVFAATMGWLATARRLRPISRLVSGPEPRLTRFQVRVAGFLGLSVLICWALMVKIDDATLWSWVYDHVPGAVGVRAVFRFNLVLVFSVVVVASVGLHAVWTAGPERFRRSLVFLLCLMTAAEQANTFDNRLSHRQHFAPLEAIPPAPAACRSFALLPVSPESAWQNSARQLDAVTLAQRVNLPTVNGYSGINPPFWGLADLGNALGYTLGLIDWADRYALWPGLCGLDVETRTWVPLTRTGLFRKANLTLSPGTRLDFTSAEGNGHRFLRPQYAWSEADTGGSWTTARFARFEGLLTGWPPGGLDLELVGSAFVCLGQPSQTIVIAVNGTVVDRLIFRLGDPAPNRYRLTIPAAVLRASGDFDITLAIDGARSPRSLGQSADTRDLGLLLVSLSFLPKAR